MTTYDAYHPALADSYDKVKYPEVAQQYRFEQCVPGEACKQNPPVITKEKPVAKEETPSEETEEASGEESVRPEILRFLDAEGAEAKLKVLRELHMDLDEGLMTTIEPSLDLLPDEKESIERRYDFAERTLEQRIRFEGGRLR